MAAPSHAATAFSDHNHRLCCGDIMSKADSLCVQDGLRLTPVRRRTLEILLEEHRALGAYDVLERLSEDGFGKQPPVAYRALEFLVEHGFAHKIRRLNAFTACLNPGKLHVPVFFLCSNCGLVAETTDQSVQDNLQAAAADMGFRIERANLEVLGVCPSCGKEDVG